MPTKIKSSTTTPKVSPVAKKINSIEVNYQKLIGDELFIRVINYVPEMGTYTGELDLSTYRSYATSPTSRAVIVQRFISQEAKENWELFELIFNKRLYRQLAWNPEDSFTEAPGVVDQTTLEYQDNSFLEYPIKPLYINVILQQPLGISAEEGQRSWIRHHEFVLVDLNDLSETALSTSLREGFPVRVPSREIFDTEGEEWFDEINRGIIESLTDKDEECIGYLAYSQCPYNATEAAYKLTSVLSLTDNLHSKEYNHVPVILAVSHEDSDRFQVKSAMFNFDGMSTAVGREISFEYPIFQHLEDFLATGHVSKFFPSRRGSYKHFHYSSNTVTKELYDYYVNIYNTSSAESKFEIEEYLRNAPIQQLNEFINSLNQDDLAELSEEIEGILNSFVRLFDTSSDYNKYFGVDGVQGRGSLEDYFSDIASENHADISVILTRNLDEVIAEVQV